MANLEIEIGADVSGLAKAIQEADRVLQTLNRNTDSVREGIRKLTDESNRYEAQLNTLNDRLNRGVISEREFAQASAEITSKISSTRQEVTAYQRELDRLNRATEQRKTALTAQAFAEEDSTEAINRNTVSSQRNVQSINSLRTLIISSIVPTNQFSSSILRAGNSLSVISNQAGGARLALSSIGAAFTGPAGLALIATTALATGIGLLTTKIREAKESSDQLESSTEKLKRAQDRYNQSLDETDRLLGRKVYEDFLEEIGALEKAYVGADDGTGKFILSQNKSIDILEEFGEKVKTLRRGELELFKQFFTTELVEAQRNLANFETGSLEAALQKDVVKGFEEALGLVNNELQLFLDAEKKLKKAVDDANISIDDQTKKTGLLFDIRSKIRELEERRNFATDEKELGLIQQRINKYQEELKLLEDRAKLLAEPIAIDRSLADPTQAAAGIDIIIPESSVAKFEDQKQQYIRGLAQISNSFGNLGANIAGVFGNIDQNQERFLRSFIGFASEIILNSFLVSKGYALQGAFASGAASGPLAAIVTPSLVASGLALVTSAFGFARGGAGAGSVGSGVGQSFSGGGVAGAFSNNVNVALTGGFTIEGEQLRYVLNQNQEYRN